jgi:uncharacterized membrane protein
MPLVGSRIYGLAAVLLGAVILAWRDFVATWQPLPAALPQPTVLAYLAGAIFVAAGLALVMRRWERLAALAVAALSLVFAAGWAGRIAGAPQVFAMWLGLAEQLAVVLGGIAVIAAGRGRAGPTAHGVRVLFGLCLLAFGTAHLLYARETAAMVPAWLPPGTRFWALATGVADIAAGLALLVGPLALVAARLATLMFLGFGALVWLPMLVAMPTDQTTWAGNAINLAIAAGAWTVADLIARAPPPVWWRRRG